MRIVLITGLPRSGTSALAAVVHACDYEMFPPGGDAKPAADLAHYYPLGNFEDLRFRQIVKDMVSEPCGGDEMKRPFRDNWREVFELDEVRSLDDWLGTRVRWGGFGVKLPAMTFVMKPFLAWCRARALKPTVLFTARRLHDAAMSLAEKRGHLHCPRRPFSWAWAAQTYREFICDLAQAACADAGVSWHVISHDEIHLPGMLRDHLERILGVTVPDEALRNVVKVQRSAA